VADPIAIECRAVFFDLDGVLVDSRRCVEQVWRQWARERGRDPAPFIQMSFGRRTSETIRLAAPELDAAAEAAALDLMEELCTEGLEPIRGVRELIQQIPAGQWGIVTSCHRPVANLRISTVGIPIPEMMVTGDEVTRGKPDPEPYRLGLERMGLRADQVVVFEDAPAGIASAKGAGIPVIALRTTHDGEALALADWRVRDFTGIRVTPVPSGLRLLL
jgi:mannitol-1-/sugar-/sorbitol-6-phosphatase